MQLSNKFGTIEYSYILAKGLKLTNNSLSIEFDKEETTDIFLTRESLTAMNIRKPFSVMADAISIECERKRDPFKLSKKGEVLFETPSIKREPKK